jgi:hypothetical protein
MGPRLRGDDEVIKMARVWRPKKRAARATHFYLTQLACCLVAATPANLRDLLSPLPLKRHPREGGDPKPLRSVMTTILPCCLRGMGPRLRGDDEIVVKVKSRVAAGKKRATCATHIYLPQLPAVWWQRRLQTTFIPFCRYH